MDGPLSDLPTWAVWLAGGVLAAALLAVVALGWLTVRTARALRRTTAAQEEARVELEQLRATLAGQSVRPTADRTVDRRADRTSDPTADPRPDYVITAVGREIAVPDATDPARELEHRVADSRQFAAIALGESLARVAVIGHGLRRALSPEARNRAAFAAKQEVRRSRKHRRDEIRAARRLLHEHQREQLAAGAPRTGAARTDRTDRGRTGDGAA